MSRRFSIAQARDRLARLIREAETGPPVELTRRGEPVAVIVSIRDFEHLRGEKVSFSDALKEFRKEHDLRTNGIEPTVFEGLRERSPGRPVRL